MIKQIGVFLFILLSIACSSQTQSIPESKEIYPVDRAHEDGDWTVLERVMPWGEPVTFLIPDWWMPSELKDRHLIKVDINQNEQTSTITFSLVEP